MQLGQATIELDGYEQFWCSAEKKGYSGTAIFAKHKPLSVTYNGMDIEEHSHEGRMITLEYENFYLINVYVPNSQDGLKRIDYRMRWEDDLRKYLIELDKKKPIILCGDMNVAHKEIDLKNPKTNRGNAGFSDEERGLANFSRQDLQILSVIFILTQRVYIAGGLTEQEQGRIMRVGVLTILSYQTGLSRILLLQIF